MHPPGKAGFSAQMGERFLMTEDSHSYKVFPSLGPTVPRKLS